MQPRKTLLMISMCSVLIAGCSKPVETAEAPVSPPVSDAAATAPVARAPVDAAMGERAQASAAAAQFDISSIPVSAKPLPVWPFVALPVGYEFDYADDLAGRSKDLARVPVWTGGQLLWVEGKVFSDRIDNADGKTYSKFEVRRNVQQVVEAMGGQRVAEQIYGEDIYKANEKEISDFRQEFSNMQNAYWYDADADTYVIRRADSVIWVVFQSNNAHGALMVVQGPLPEPTRN